MSDGYRLDMSLVRRKTRASYNIVWNRFTPGQLRLISELLALDFESRVKRLAYRATDLRDPELILPATVLMSQAMTLCDRWSEVPLYYQYLLLHTLHEIEHQLGFGPTPVRLHP